MRRTVNEEHLYVMQFMQKQGDVIYQIEAKLLDDSATSEDLSNAIRILKNDHRLLTALFRRLGVPLNYPPTY